MEKKWNHGYKCLGLHVYIVCLSDPSLSKYCPLFSHNYRKFVLTTNSSFLSYLSFPYLISIGLSIIGLWLRMNAREEHSTSNISSHTEVTPNLGCISMNWRNAAEVSGLTWVWIQSLLWCKCDGGQPIGPVLPLTCKRQPWGTSVAGRPSRRLPGTHGSPWHGHAEWACNKAMACWVLRRVLLHGQGIRQRSILLRSPARNWTKCNLNTPLPAPIIMPLITTRAAGTLLG